MKTDDEFLIAIDVLIIVAEMKRAELIPSRLLDPSVNNNVKLKYSVLIISKKQALIKVGLSYFWQLNKMS